MCERFTDRAVEVMKLANHLARRLGHETLLPEHVLYGLVMSESSYAVTVLQNLGQDPQSIAKEVKKRLDPEQKGTADEFPFGDLRSRLPHSDETKRLVDVTVAEARQLGHNYAGTEHLLLALLRAEDCLAYRILTDFGLTYSGVRLEVLNVLGVGLASTTASQKSPGSQPADSQTKELDDEIDRLVWKKALAVIEEDFDKAAKLRDRIAELNKHREENTSSPLE